MPIPTSSPKPEAEASQSPKPFADHSVSDVSVISQRSYSPSMSHRSWSPYDAGHVDSGRHSSGSNTSGSRAESTLPGDSSSIVNEDITTYNAAADLRDAVVRITKNNMMLEAEMERTRAELVSMADACKQAQQQTQNAEGTIIGLDAEINRLKMAKQAAERELEKMTRNIDKSKALLAEFATQTEQVECTVCITERQLREKVQKDREDMQCEVRKLRYMIIEGQRQLAECESRCCDWQERAEVEYEGRKRAEKERESIKAAAIQLNMKWEEAKKHMKRDAQYIAELRNRVEMLEQQHAQMGKDLLHTRAHLKQLQVEMEANDINSAKSIPPQWVAEARAHLQAEEILYRTYIEAGQAGAWQLLLAEYMPAPPSEKRRNSAQKSLHRSLLLC